MIRIIGISAFYHDSSACLIEDGSVEIAIQEERLSRVKHDSSFPIKSINKILHMKNIEIKDIDFFVFYEKPFLKFERLLESAVATFPKSLKLFIKSMPLWVKDRIFQKKNILKYIKKIDKNFNDLNKIKFSEHHLSHAASTFFPSNLDKAIIITIDGVGEWVTSSISVGDNNNITRHYSQHFPHSLGLLYSAFTSYIGFAINDGEYKVMGLAPYGKPIYSDLILKKIISLKEDGSFILNLKYFDFIYGEKTINSKFENLFQRKTRLKNDKIEQFHMDVACSIQNVIEKIILRIAEFANKELKLENLCLSGGVALNCTSNSYIYKSKIFKNIWIQPAAGDAGGSVGAALAFWHIALKNKRIVNSYDSMNFAYLGPSESKKEIIYFLEKNNIQYNEYTDDGLSKYIAKEILDDKVIGWHQNRMEFGPRSLGNRSILANPLNKNMQQILNKKIKFREGFRPFAPSILQEFVSDWFEDISFSPYMLFITNVKESKLVKLTNDQFNKKGLNKINIERSVIPAVTHVNNSARVQTVNSQQNPKFYQLIKDFYKISNCPILINTSFNINNEPITCDVNDSFKCFMTTDIDLLVIDNFVIKKQKKY